MSVQMTLWDSHSAISLQESECGVMPCGLPGGPTIDPSGRDRAHASRFQLPEKEQGHRIADICGQTCSASLGSEILQSFLVSRLQARMDCYGSTLYKLTWKVRDTPSGRRICALRASALRTSGNGCFGWVTPASRDWKDTPGMKAKRRDGKKRIDQLPRQAFLAGWATPTATDANRGIKPPRPHDTGIPLTQMIGLIESGFPARFTNSGDLLTGSDAGMMEILKSGVRLNPEHSRWLMGIPPAWEKYAPTGTQSSRRSRRNS